jgi:hypothetical protein
MKGIKWFFAEFLVVVTGVLVAFALNSWWVGLKEENKEEVYLEQVLQDIDNSVFLMEEAIEFQRNATHSSARFLESFYRKGLRDDLELYLYSLDLMSFEPGGIVQSTLLSLVNSGDLQLITSDSIRMELADLSGMLQGCESQRQIITSEMLFPGFKEFSAYLSPFDMSFYQLDSASYDQAVQDSLMPLPSAEMFQMPDEVDWSEMMQNEDFKAKATFMYLAHLNLLRLHRNVLNRLTTARERIDLLLD